MKVLKPSTVAQTFYFIPRDYQVGGIINFRDDQTNEIVTYTPTMVQENDFIKVTGIFNLREGHFYDLRVGSSENIWNENQDNWELSTDNWDENGKDNSYIIDKVFCTEQTVDQAEQKEYDINKGVYKTQNSFNNDYIIL